MPRSIVAPFLYVVALPAALAACGYVEIAPHGTSGGSGYIKNYNYDDRLRYLEPPSFIEPQQSDWVIGRETIG